MSLTFANSHRWPNLTEAVLQGIMAGQKPVKVYDPISSSIHEALTSRLSEYSSPRRVSLFTGTWNLCGKALSGAVEDWLFPEGKLVPDIPAQFKLIRQEPALSADQKP